MTTPPFAATSLSTSSDTLRGWSSSARADECEKMTGALVTLSAARIVSSLTWLRSTSMPRRFNSPTTATPNGVRPWWTGASFAESAHAMVLTWVSVR